MVITERFSLDLQAVSGLRTITFVLDVLLRRMRALFSRMSTSFIYVLAKALLILIPQVIVCGSPYV